MDKDKERVLNVKVSADLHKKLKVQAAQEGLSIKDLVSKAFEEYIKRHSESLAVSK